jgi:hypothetical protein
MRIYLMARYSRHPELQVIRDELEALGHVVTARWINGGHALPESIGGDTPLDYGRRFAREDWEDLTSADCAIGFTESPGVANPGKGGRHVEMGVALGRGKRVIIVGPRENVFCYLPQVEVFDSWAEALAVLARAGVARG